MHIDEYKKSKCLKILYTYSFKNYKKSKNKIKFINYSKKKTKI